MLNNELKLHEKEIWNLYDTNKLLVGEIVNVDMFGEGYDMLIFMYRANPKDKPIVLFVEYGAILVNNNEQAVEKYMEQICQSLLDNKIIRYGVTTVTE